MSRMSIVVVLIASTVVFSRDFVWENVQPMPHGKWGAAATTVGEKIYVIGGHTEPWIRPYGGICESYDVSTNLWTRIRDFYHDDERYNTSDKPGRYDMSAIAVNGLIYIFGGTVINGTTNCNHIDVYNPLTDTWKNNEFSYPIAASGIALAEYDGKIYCFGGSFYQSANPDTDKVYEFNPGDMTGTLVPLTPMPTARTNAFAATVGDKIYVIGGYSRDENKDLDMMEVFDPRTNQWDTHYPRVPDAGKISGGVIDNKIYVNVHNTCSVFEYDPFTNTWTEINSLPSAREGHCMVVVKDDLYVLGGRETCANDSHIISTATRGRLTNSSTAYYPFNGNANDVSGNENHGTVYGPSLANDRFGNTDSAYYFDGRDDYISIPDSPGLDLPGDFTIAFWIKHLKGGSNELLGKHRKHYNEERGWFMFLESDGRLSMEVYDHTGPWNPRIEWTTLLEKERWTHVAVTYDRNSYVYMTYINGEIDTVWALDLDIRDTSFPLRLGTQQGGITGCFAGFLDELYFYSRVLTEPEIKKLTQIQFEIIISPTNGGTVLPSEGTYAYPLGKFLTIEAYPLPGHRFLGWTGSAVDADRVENPSSLKTSLTVDSHYSLQASFERIPNPVYVNATPNDYEDGSEEHPFDTIQEAIDLAEDEATVIIGPGIYRGIGNHDILFKGKSLTIQSYDPNYPDKTIIDCGGKLDEPHRGFFITQGEGPRSVINGVTIQNGYDYNGGAIYCYGSSPTIKHCIMRNNISLNDGGALYIASNSSPEIRNCTFQDNQSDRDGGGIANVYNRGTPTITDCNICNNTAGRRGGGINSIKSELLSIDRCEIKNNDARSEGGGLYLRHSMANLTETSVVDNTVETRETYGSSIFASGDEAELVFTDCSYRFGQMAFEDDCYVKYDGSKHIVLDSHLAVDAKIVFGGGVHVTGSHSINVGSQGELIFEDHSVLDLGGEPGGRIKSVGVFRARGNARIENTKIEVARLFFEDRSKITANDIISVEAGVPYGQFYIENDVKVVDNYITADGDRYLDLDTSVFRGIIRDNKIDVTVTEGQNNTRGGLFELRGRDFYDSSCALDRYACQSDDVLDLNFNDETWVLENLTLKPGAKLNLTNRFDFGNGDFNEVLYVKCLTLDANSVLNTAYNRIYYGELYPPEAITQIVNVPLLGFSLNLIACDDALEFASRVKTNNFNKPVYDDPFSRDPNLVVQLWKEPSLPDPCGVMLMQNLLADESNPNALVNARANGLFAKSNEQPILIYFDYLFEADDINYPAGEDTVELIVYLSSYPELLDHHDPCRPKHYLEIGRLHPPRRGRPGSVGSGRFGRFHKYANRAHLDFTRGTRVELELRGPKGTCVLIDNWDPQIHCPKDKCLNFLPNAEVEFLDLIPILGETGRTAELNEDGSGSECVDGPLSCDGHVDCFDVASFEWAIVDNRKYNNNFCPANSNTDRGLALTGSCFAGECRDVLSHQPRALSLIDLDRFETPSLPQTPLRILGKPFWDTSSSVNIIREKLYGVNPQSYSFTTHSLQHDRCNIRLISDRTGQFYQIALDRGLLRIRPDGSTATTIGPGVLPYAGLEPRYQQTADIQVGIQEDHSIETGLRPVGRAIWDMAIDKDDVSILYGVPVVVVPEIDPPYLAAARFRLDNSQLGYHIDRLYDDPTFFDVNTPDNPNLGGLREIEVDDAGNVFILNVHRRNESTVLWCYDSEGHVQNRLELDNPNGAIYIENPIGLYYSQVESMIYIADANSRSDEYAVYGLSGTDFSPKRKISIENLDYITGITGNATGTLWVIGYNKDQAILDAIQYEKDEKRYDDVKQSFCIAGLAEIPRDRNHVKAIRVENCDLGMPLSVLWVDD